MTGSARQGCDAVFDLQRSFGGGGRTYHRLNARSVLMRPRAQAPAAVWPRRAARHTSCTCRRAGLLGAAPVITVRPPTHGRALCSASWTSTCDAQLLLSGQQRIRTRKVCSSREARHRSAAARQRAGMCLRRHVPAQTCVCVLLSEEGPLARRGRAECWWPRAGPSV